MSAFVNGAISAIKQAIEVAEQEEKKHTNLDLTELKYNLLLLMKYYKAIDDKESIQLGITEALESFDKENIDDKIFKA